MDIAEGEGVRSSDFIGVVCWSYAVVAPSAVTWWIGCKHKTRLFRMRYELALGKWVEVTLARLLSDLLKSDLRACLRLTRKTSTGHKGCTFLCKGIKWMRAMDAICVGLRFGEVNHLGRGSDSSGKSTSRVKQGSGFVLV
jgi:hypothetical protein